MSVFLSLCVCFCVSVSVCLCVCVYTCKYEYTFLCVWIGPPIYIVYIIHSDVIKEVISLAQLFGKYECCQMLNARYSASV